MRCPHCQTETASAFGYCTSCGKALTQLDGPPPPPPGGGLGASAAAGPARVPVPSAPKANRVAMVVAIIVAALVVALFAFGMLARSFESPQQRVARLMREASGTQPVHQAWLPSQRRLDDAMREQFRKLIQTNRDYTEQVKKADISEVKRINSPESFVDPDYAAPGLHQLHALYDIDSGQEQKVKEIMDNLRHILANETSGSDREAA